MGRFPTLAALLLALGACAAPDYPGIRDWTGTAGLVMSRSDMLATARPDAARAEAALAMQSVLSAYLGALGTLALNGPLPYRDPPFGPEAARAAPVNPEAAAAITAIAVQLQHASTTQATRRALGDAIRLSDPAVQVLVRDLAAAVPVQGGPQPATIAADYARMQQQARAPLDRRALQDLGALREQQEAVLVAAYAGYRDALLQIGQTHAALAAQAAHLGQQEVYRQLRAAQDRLQRILLQLPPPAALAAPGPVQR